jgi:hypothetical protein
VVFSPTPCGAAAKKVDTSGALKTGTSPNLQGVSDRAALGAIDGDCRSRELAINDAANSELARIEAEVRHLRDELNRSANNYAGATRDNGLRAQIDGAEARRSATIGQRNSDLNALSASCDQRRAAELQREAERDRGRTTAAATSSP